MTRPSLEAVEPRWDGVVFVAAPGPSLTEAVAAKIAGRNVIAVQDAWRRVPSAPVLYGCEAAWWNYHRGCRDYFGERWSTHDDVNNDKAEVAERYGVRLVSGRVGRGFCTDPHIIHYGRNSGFQAVNLAIHMTRRPATVVLVGFDMRRVDGVSHFFGEHPDPLTAPPLSLFIPPFQTAAAWMPDDVTVLNATPGSALQCFPMVELEDVL